MADALIKLLQARTVHISAGKSIGTGTLIAPGRVLTCAHVVRKAIDSNLEIRVSLPDLSQPDKFMWTETVIDSFLSDKWTEIKTKDKDEGGEEIELSTEYPDIAVLSFKLEEDKDKEEDKDIEEDKVEDKEKNVGITQLPYASDVIKLDEEKKVEEEKELQEEKKVGKVEHALLRLPDFDAEQEGLQDKQFLAYGFQKKQKELLRNVPQGVSLDYDAEQGTGPLRKIMVKNGLVRHGMSGAALVDRSNGELVGIVHMTRNPNDDLGAYVVPVEIIWHVFQKWEEAKICSIFSEVRSRKIQKKIAKQYANDFPQFSRLHKYKYKLLSFLILILASLLWGFYHFGWTTGSGVASVILVAVSIFSALLGGWLGQGVNEETGKFRDKIGKALLGKIGLIIIFIGFIGIGFMWTYRSSIWIYGYSESDKIEFLISEVDNSKVIDTIMLEFDGTTSNLFPSLPLGEKLKISTLGRKDTIVELKSFSRVELYYPRDFPKEYVAIFKFDPVLSLQGIMKDNLIEVKIERKIDGDWVELDNFKIEPKDSTGTIVFGRKFNYKEKEIEWENKLRNEILPKDQLSLLLPSSLNAWTKRILYIPNKDLNLNDKITFKVYNTYYEKEFIKDYTFDDEYIDAYIKFEE